MKRILATALAIQLGLAGIVEGGRRRAVNPGQTPDDPTLTHIVAGMTPEDDLTFSNYGPTRNVKICATACKDYAFAAGETKTVDNVQQQVGAGVVEVHAGSDVNVGTSRGLVTPVSTATARNILPSLNPQANHAIGLYLPNAGDVEFALIGNNGVEQNVVRHAFPSGISSFDPRMIQGYGPNMQLELRGARHVAFMDSQGTILPAKNAAAEMIKQYIIDTATAQAFIKHLGHQGTLNMQNTFHPSGVSASSSRMLSVMPYGIVNVSNIVEQAGGSGAGTVVLSGNGPSAIWALDGTAAIPVLSDADAASKEYDTHFNQDGKLSLYATADQALTVVTYDGAKQITTTYDMKANTARSVDVKGRTTISVDEKLDGLVLGYVRKPNGSIQGPYRVKKEIAKPRIIGVDYNNDGVVDNADADGNGVADRVEGVSCTAPFPWEGYLASTPAASTYFAGDLPQGMSFNQGTGKIIYSPPCTSAGSTYRPAFVASGNEGTPFVVQFRVN